MAENRRLTSLQSAAVDLNVMIASFVVSLLLIGICGVLLDGHRRNWFAAQQDQTLSDGDRRFARSQFRRRMQASGIIGVVGAAIGIGPLVPREPGPFALYLAVLLGACASIMLLALLDIWATRQHFRRVHGEQHVERLMEIWRLRSARKSPDADAGNAGITSRAARQLHDRRTNQ